MQAETSNVVKDPMDQSKRPSSTLAEGDQLPEDEASKKPRWEDICKQHKIVNSELSQVKRKKGNLTEPERKLREIVQRRRLKSHECARKYLEKSGRFLTISAIDKVQRMKSENDLLDSNVEVMISKVKDLRVKFEARLAKRTADIIAGHIDPEEPAGKETERQIRQWLSTVPVLLAYHERKLQADVKFDKELTDLSTTYNFIDAGNNRGNRDAIKSTVMTEIDIINLVASRQKKKELQLKEGEEDDDASSTTSDSSISSSVSSINEKDGEEAADVEVENDEDLYEYYTDDDYSSDDDEAVEEVDTDDE